MVGEGWQQTKVDEMIRRGVLALNDGYRVRNVELGPVGIPFVRGGDIGDGGINTTVEDHVRPEFADRVQSKLTRPFDVAFITKGTVGRVGMVRPGQPPSVFAPQVCYWRSLDPDQLEPRFIFYLLTSAEFQANLDAVKTHGSMAADYVSMTDQRDFRLTFPPIREQKAIAAVLGALDDKIDLNRRMNATLEAIARALFQSWFVDFDPVRAKIDGRAAALDPVTAALFPASFDESELGHIPHGWDVKKLGEVVELAYGKPLKAEDRKNGSVCVYGANGPVGWHDEKLVSGPGIVVGRKGNPGVVTWAHGDFYPIDTTFYVEPIGACRSLYFFYYALSQHNLANLSADSAVPGLNRNHAYMSKQVIPSQFVVTAFDSQVAPIYAAVHANEVQSRSLGTLRDTLLPKLLSGELDVSKIPKAGTQWSTT